MRGGSCHSSNWCCGASRFNGRAGTDPKLASCSNPYPILPSNAWIAERSCRLTMYRPLPTRADVGERWVFGPVWMKLFVTVPRTQDIFCSNP